MNATTGTNASIWFNFLIAAAGAVASVIDPAMLAAVLGKFGGLAPIIVAGINWLLHSFTGNSATQLLPNPVIPTTVNPGSAVNPPSTV